MSEFFDLTTRFTKKNIGDFAARLQSLSRQIGFKVSSRGWCYILEQNRFINKDQFNKVEELINRCRREGYLPVDFVAEEDARKFHGVERPTTERSVKGTLQWMLRDVLDGARFFTPDWWEGEDYYIQMIVEKTDLVTLFQPVCSDYHIPIANSKGWSSILQRAEYAKRFKQAEEKGLQCVLLYCGDHDPDGLRISDTIRKNLEQVSEITWENGSYGYNPQNLEIMRFGLNYDFIEANQLTWIDNLITGSGKNLADPRHPNYKLPYLQNYLNDIGERKCEANAIVTAPKIARQLCREAIIEIIGDDAEQRFEEKREAIDAQYEQLLDQYNLRETVEELLENSEYDEDEDE